MKIESMDAEAMTQQASSAPHQSVIQSRIHFESLDGIFSFGEELVLTTVIVEKTSEFCDPRFCRVTSGECLEPEATGWPFCDVAKDGSILHVNERGWIAVKRRSSD